MKRTVMKMMSLALSGALLLGLGSCGSKNDDSAAGDSGKKVLRVGMECAYAPFNWTQVTDEVPDGSKALPIYGSSDYAYGYDVMVAQKLADEMGIRIG